MPPTHTVTFIPGDGTGPEIAEATRRVLDAAADVGGFAFDWEVQYAGAEVGERTGDVLPEHVLDSIRTNKVAIKGPLTTPVGKGFRSVNVALRKELDLYACLRPCRTYAGAPSKFPDFDVVVVRENTEDLYAGVEFEEGTAEAARLIEFISELGGGTIRPDSGISIKPISIGGTERIVRFALDYARTNGRKKVTAVHKANIMKFSDGLYLEVARRVATEYPDVEFDDWIVDIMTQLLITRPHDFDVAGAAQPIRRCRVGPVCRDHRRRGAGAGRQYRYRGRRIRADPRQRTAVRRSEQGQPDGDDPLRRLDAAPLGRAGDGRPPRSRRSHGDCRGEERDLRPQGRPHRPHGGRDLAGRRRNYRGAASGRLRERGMHSCASA